MVIIKAVLVSQFLHKAVASAVHTEQSQLNGLSARWNLVPAPHDVLSRHTFNRTDARIAFEDSE